MYSTSSSSKKAPRSTASRYTGLPRHQLLLLLLLLRLPIRDKNTGNVIMPVHVYYSFVFCAGFMMYNGD